MREQARQREWLSEATLGLFIDSVQDYAIFMLDPRGYIVSWNAGAQRIKGYTAEEIIGQHFSIFYEEADKRRGHPAQELAIATREGSYSEENWRLRKDGSRFWASVTITVVRDRQGRLVGFGKVTRDLTERKLQEELELRLRRDRAEAEASSRAQSQFLTAMSHELRTPLNAVIGYVDLLELGVQGPLTAEQRTSLDRIKRSSQLLLGLINDVLNLSRIEEGYVPFELRPVPVQDLLTAVEPLLRPQMKALELQFEVEKVEPELMVNVDLDRAQQILLNLLTNAAKFTPAQGRIWIDTDANESRVHIHVHDTGRGIDRSRHEAIFEPFVQIDRHLNIDSQQGVGLGLAISRHLARDMGGDLTVKSEVDRGSTFTLTLPHSRGGTNDSD